MTTIHVYMSIIDYCQLFLIGRVISFREGVHKGGLGELPGTFKDGPQR